MEWLHTLFFGSGIAHAVLTFALVITIGILLGKVKIGGISLGITWILFVGYRPESFRNDGGRRGQALRAGIRADSVRLLDRSASRTGIFRIVQARRHDAGHVCRSDRTAGRGDGLCSSSGDGHADSDDGRHPFGRSDQHPRTGCRAAGLHRCVGNRRPHDRAGIRRGLSARRRGHHIHR